MLKRNIKQGKLTFRSYTATDIGTDAVAWLEKQSAEGMTLLAHADDGVIWGKVTDGKLAFPSDTLLPQAEFRTTTLRMARLFDSQQSLFLWRVDEGTWQARYLCDGQGDPWWYFDEPQVLWGTHVEQVEQGFACMADGIQGLRHAPPAMLTPDELESGEEWNRNRLRLCVRHYLTEDKNGWLRIHMSRLTYLYKE